MRRISSSHFIWAAARNQDSTALKRALSSELIDIYEINFPETSVITHFAKAIDKKATYFLLSFGAQKIFAVLGAAMSGNEAWLDELLEYQNKPFLNMAARGAAMAGNRSLANKLAMRGADHEAILFGAAMGKHFEWVDALLSRNPIPKCFDLAAKGAAIAKADNQVTLYLQKGATIKSIVCGAAIAGNIDFAMKMLALGSYHPDLINECAYGLALGGNQTVLNQFCRSHQPNMNRVLLALAQRGDHHAAESLLRLNKLDPKYILFGAAIGKHTAWLEKLKNHYVADFLQHEKSLARFQPHQKITLDEANDTKVLDYFFAPRHAAAPTFFSSEHDAVAEKAKAKTPAEEFTLDETDSDSDTFSLESN